MTKLEEIKTQATEAQSRASDPSSSVWVSASAGSGKTRVLTDRVLRMLLKGVPPSKIICLTFTKAAAGEMANRINDSLKEWSILEEDKLIDKLKTLTNSDKIPDKTLSLARKLFAKILDNPLNIQTLHSFCQKILKRFPMEAGISPHFEILEESVSQDILHDCIISSVKNRELQEDIENILSIINEEDFKKLNKSLMENRKYLFKLRQSYGDILFTELYKFFGIEKSLSEEEVFKYFLQDVAGINYIKFVVNSHKGKTYLEKITHLNLFLNQNLSNEIRVNAYVSCFINKNDRDISKNAISFFEKYNLAEFASREALRCQELKDKIKTIKLCNLNESLLKFSFDVLNKYEQRKVENSYLDYNDLIFKTLSLLKQSDINPWIMFKLDGGIDHILIDEAQDTSPEFWQIIQLLTIDFFSGQSLESSLDKTLFSVGDEKQSIYSFQGANLQLFQQAEKTFAKKIKESQKIFQKIPLNTSFRSFPKILEFVDAVFEGDNRNGVSSTEIKHQAAKENSVEYIEVWDRIVEEKSEEDLSLTATYSYSFSSAELMAKRIANKIEELLNSKKLLPSTQKEVSPGDIMILLNTRKANFLIPLYKELRQKEIPTEGFDRFKLKDELLIDDVICLIRFLLFRDDDLSLAELLKTPFINMSEEDLFNLSHARYGSLWESLKISSHVEIVKYLEELFNRIDFVRPYEFINSVFNFPCPANAISAKRSFLNCLGESAEESLEELLNFCLSFEASSVISMQEFLHEIEINDVTIKRELNKSNKVKILTIHGAKGLESPIVFLPDTLLSHNFIKENIFWNEEFPVWIPNDSWKTEKAGAIKNSFTSQAIEEYKRLLYVALTRAQDSLYIGAYGSKSKEESWYNMIVPAIKKLGQQKNNCWVYEGSGTVIRKEKENREAETKVDNCDFIFTPVSEEISTINFSSPSKLEKESFISPFFNFESIFFKRGLIIHKLLEILPNCSNKSKSCLDFLKLSKHHLTPIQIEEISSEVLHIFEKYPFLFGENSFAEVPIIGEVNGSSYSGVIDRLCITDDSIIIVDYKSNRPPSNSAEDTPIAYKKQLSIYKEILQKIYPDKIIKTAIIWTNTSKLFFLEL